MRIRTGNKKIRKIMHMDGDAFFASVEISKDPSLRGKPVVTGKERGIVSSMSYEAKALGVTRGFPIYRLKKEFPEVTVVPGDYDSYSIYSQKMINIVRKYSDEVEEYSIDECFADLTDTYKFFKMSDQEVLEKIKKEIYDELQITVSVGLAETKVLAKVASKFQKPNGLTIIPPGKQLDFLEKVKIGNVWGIGPRTEVALLKRGFKTAADLANQKEEWVKSYFSKPFQQIWLELNAVSVLAINTEPKTEYSSISRTHTFVPSRDPVFIFSELSKNIEQACEKARAYNFAAKKIYIFLKTQTFRYSNAEIKLNSPLNTAETILPIVRRKFERVFNRGTLYRATGVFLSDLVSDKITQLDLFGESKNLEKIKNMYVEVDKIKEKFGSDSIFIASSLKSRQQKRKALNKDKASQNKFISHRFLN